jgi:hypothetical protein
MSPISKARYVSPTVLSLGSIAAITQQDGTGPYCDGFSMLILASMKPLLANDCPGVPNM